MNYRTIVVQPDTSHAAELEKEKTDRSEEDRQLRGTLHQTATGGLDLAVYGVIALAVANLYCTFPREIACHENASNCMSSGHSSNWADHSAGKVAISNINCKGGPESPPLEPGFVQSLYSRGDGFLLWRRYFPIELGAQLCDQGHALALLPEAIPALFDDRPKVLDVALGVTLTGLS
jgi:hypothetical protein